MNFSECSPQPVPRFGSIVQYDDATLLPIGVASSSRNNRWTAQGVSTRWGFKRRLNLGTETSPVSAVGMIRYLAPDNSGAEVIKMLACTQADGNVYDATPFNQTTSNLLSDDLFLERTNLTRVPNLYPVIAQAYNKGVIARGNLTSGVAPSMIYDPIAETLDELSDKPVGVPWSPGMSVRVGHVISPSTFETYGLPVAEGEWVAATTGHLYTCTQYGITGGTQPAWPTTPGAFDIADGTAKWMESTVQAFTGLPDPAAPIFLATAADAASPIVAGATAFVAATYVNSVGEAINEVVTPAGLLDPAKVLQWVNGTGGAVDLSVMLPAIPASLAVGGVLGDKGASAFNLYAYITTTADPLKIADVAKYTDPTYYAQVAAGVAPGATVTISAFPTGQALPTLDTANVSSVGNVDAGVRYMVEIFETRTRYQTGFGASSPVRVNVTNSGLRVKLENLHLGPYNTVSRIYAFTVAGASKAGPYFYVDRNDVESPGFNQADIPITSTRINDNTTTTAEFNFTDGYLAQASEITDFVNRIEVPPASHAYFAKTLGRVIYTGCKGFPSGFLVSDNTDPEAVRVPGSNLQCSEADGDRTVCWVELRETEIALKENSAHVVQPNNGDPNTWPVQELWRGSGPVGAKAADVGTEDQSQFLVYAHKTGPYLYQGNAPKLIGREIGASMATQLQGYWKRINWAVGYKIVVRVDSSRREVRFSVPLDAATENSHTFTLSYVLGWDDPIVFSVRQGREIPNLNGRRWSIDDIAAMDWAYIPQRYQVTASQDGVDVNDAMILAGNDGAIYTLTEGQLWDEDAEGGKHGYLSEWISVPGQNQNLNLFSLHGASVSVSGSGNINIFAVDDTGARFQITKETRVCLLGAKETQRDLGVVGAQSARFGIGFDNGAVVGAGFNVHQAILWIKKAWSQRRG